MNRRWSLLLVVGLAGLALLGATLTRSPHFFPSAATFLSSLTVSGEATMQSTLTVTGATALHASLTTTGSITPSVTNVPDLGTTTVRYRDLYLARNAHVTGHGFVGGTLHAAASVVLAASHAVTIASEGTVAVNIERIFPANRTVFAFTCNDANGCTLILDESNLVQGQVLVLVNLGTNTVNVSDTTGVSEVSASPVALGQYDTIGLLYLSDRWVQLFTSNN